MREKKRWDHRENLLLASGKKSRIATALGYVKAYAGNGEKHVYFFLVPGFHARSLISVVSVMCVSNT